MKSIRLHWAIATVFGSIGLGLLPISAKAQGCEPIRFTVPVSLGGEGEEIHTGIADLAYAFSDRVRARVSIPFSRGSLTRIWADRKEHAQSASGIGDISVQGEAWLFEPRSHERGNIAIGLGLKAPTGSHTKRSQFFLANGPVDFPADQTIQPGDGGWAILTQLQAFRQLNERASLYAVGSYMVSSRDQTELKGSPGPGPTFLFWSVPDVYSLRTGAAGDLRDGPSRLVKKMPRHQQSSPPDNPLWAWDACVFAILSE